MSLRDLPDSIRTPMTQNVGESQGVGKSSSPILHHKSNHVDPETKAHTDEIAKVIQGKAAQILGETSTTSKNTMSKTIGRAFGKALTGLRDAVTTSAKNIFPQSEAQKSPRTSNESSPKTSPRAEKKDYSSLSAEEMKNLFLTDEKGNNIGESSTEKQDFCKAFLSKLGDAAGAFVRERSEEMYAQVTNVQSIGRESTPYTALATAYLDSKLQFQNSEGFKQLQNAVKNPKENRYEDANSIWSTITQDLMRVCKQDPDLKQFMQQLYSSHLAIFQKGQETGKTELQDTQMKSGGEVKSGVFTMKLSAEECASKMVLNTLILRVINPAIVELTKIAGNPTEKEELLAFSKIFQGGVNLTVKNERQLGEGEKVQKANKLMEQTETFITQHKDQILDFGRQFAPSASPRWESRQTQGNTSPTRAGSPQLGMQRSQRAPIIDLSTPDVVAPAQAKKSLPSVEVAQAKKQLNSISAEISKPGAKKNEIVAKLDALLESQSFQQVVNDTQNGLEDQFNRVLDQLDKAFPKTPSNTPRSDLEQ